VLKLRRTPSMQRIVRGEIQGPALYCKILSTLVLFIRCSHNVTSNAIDTAKRGRCPEIRLGKEGSGQAEGADVNVGRRNMKQWY
jgi:hypothetical protein